MASSDGAIITCDLKHRSVEKISLLRVKTHTKFSSSEDNTNAVHTKMIYMMENTMQSLNY